MKLEDRIKLLIQLLKSRGIQFEKGLTNEELITVEANFDITFPPDFQTLLCLELPVSKGFVNWRKALSSKEYEDEVFDKLNRPLDGMLFDIENNAFGTRIGVKNLKYSNGKKKLRQKISRNIRN